MHSDLGQGEGRGCMRLEALDRAITPTNTNTKPSLMMHPGPFSSPGSPTIPSCSRLSESTHCRHRFRLHEILLWGLPQLKAVLCIYTLNATSSIKEQPARGWHIGWRTQFNQGTWILFCFIPDPAIEDIAPAVHTTPRQVDSH